MNGSTLVILLALLAGSALAWRRGARALATALVLVAALPAVTLLKQTPIWAVVAIGVVLVGVLWHRHARTAATITRWSAMSRRKAGVASTMDIARVASAPAMRRKAASVRPSLAQTTRRARWLQLVRLPAVEVAVRLCRVGAQSVWASVEDFIVVFGGPRTGKTQWLAGRIIDASGAVLVTSTRTDLLDITAPLRGRKGPVYVFNAVGMAGLPSTITFDPLTGCTDPTTAAERAADLLGASRGGSGDREFWDAQGRRVLAALMHAAALGGLHMRDVLGWVADPDSAGRVESLLRRSPEDAFVQEARQFISTNDRTRSSITSTIMPALGWLTSSAAAAAADGSTPFDVAELLASRATVYLLGAEETQAAPLVCALTGHVAREARRIAAGCPGGRLDPPLTLALDEAALISPVPLQSWSADMGGRGVTIISAFQSRAQLLARYGQHDAATTLNNAGSVMVFGGTRDRDDLNFWATLGGERDEPITTTDLHGRVASRTVRKVPVVAPAQIANLPAGRVVTFRRGMPPVVGTVDMAWRRRDVRALSRPGGRWERPRRAWAWLTRPPLSPAHQVVPIARDLPVWVTARPDEGWRN